MMSNNIKSPISLLFFFLSLALMSIKLRGMTSHATAAVIRCHKVERQALLELKRRLDDPSNRLSSWVRKDCCAWKGIGCSNVTGHVIMLNLRNEQYLYDDGGKFDLREELSYLESQEFALYGDISTASSLLSLEELTHLDLSGNDFSGSNIPAFVGSFPRLTYLNLSHASFSGRVPDELGNLSTLRHLDLSYNYYYVYLYVENPRWIARLTYLQHLNMSSVSFGGASSWIQVLNALPHIEDIELAWCDLIGPLPHSPLHLNFTTLRTLNLEGNNINATEPMWMYNITTLESLNFGWNDIHWLSIHGSISMLTSLRTLDLSENSISKKFLLSLSNLCKLQILFLQSMQTKDAPYNLEMVFSGCLMYSLEELHLQDNKLSGFSLGWFGNLKNLKHIDLSENLLYGSIPNSFGSLTSLQYLDLSFNNLNGVVGGSIGQLKNLIHLDLSYNSLSLSQLHLDNLSNLKYLDISNSTLLINDTNNWMPPFQLQFLFMDWCKILPSPYFPKWLQTQTSLSLLSFTNAKIQDKILSWLHSSLIYLDLSNNMINGNLAHFFPNLTILRLSSNSFTGNLPLQMGSMMPSFKELDLSNNHFIGELSQNFTKLQLLDLSNNLFSRNLPLQMGHMMPSLKELNLSNNHFTGELSQNFTKLQLLDLSNNLFSGNLPLQMGNMMPSLYELLLYNNNFTGEVPQNFTKLQILDLSMNSFSGHLPLKMGNTMPSLTFLNLSYNYFIGEVPQNFTKLDFLDLSNNSFSGHFRANMMPSLIFLNLYNNYFTGVVQLNFTRLEVLDLSNNLFSGHLNPTINNTFSNLGYFDISMNKFIGSIPHSFCQMNSLYSLSLSKNNFIGELPNCWNSSSEVTTIDFSNNQIHGEIPNTICNQRKIQSLHLSNNNLSGRIPLCLQDYKNLVILDVGHNNFIGDIPPWSKKSLSYLKSLSLHSNSLTGNIPELSHLAYLQILDLSNNNLSGSIPPTFGDFNALKSSHKCNDNLDNELYDELWLNIKGIEYEYKRLLGLLTAIDLSNNDLSGYIPMELGNLHGLQNLNLSRNNLVGEIPKSINGMQNLEVLDLSRNILSGTIPSVLANLNFLDNLNLSYNNLSGSIPLGSQLQTLDPSAYMGNTYLCGPPLIKKCANGTTKGSLKEESKKDNGGREIIWLFASITLGFIMGFWGTLGTLLLHKSWRIIYYSAIDNTIDKLYIVMLVKIRRRLL